MKKKFILLLFFIISIFAFKFCNVKYRLYAWCQNHPLCTKIFPFIKPKVTYTRGPYILALYQTMKDVHHVLSHLKLTYWADYGTLLGAMRHKGIIPWDDDCDITMPFTDRENFVQKAIPLLKKLGYDVTISGQGMIKVSSKDIHLNPHELAPACDVFFAKDLGDSYCVDQDACSDAKPIQKKNLFPLKLHPFGSFFVNVPSHSTPYLDDYFGKNWSFVAYKGPQHQYEHKEERIKKIKFSLDQKLYAPAQPIGPLKEHKID